MSQITAKFDGYCRACKGGIKAGEKIEWSKDAGSNHIECPANPSPAPQRATSARSSRPRNWRPCGYPGCKPSYCDECDGKGGGARY